jgi:hypothetical protein
LILFGSLDIGLGLLDTELVIPGLVWFILRIGSIGFLDKEWFSWIWFQRAATYISKSRGKKCNLNFYLFFVFFEIIAYLPDFIRNTFKSNVEIDADFS